MRSQLENSAKRSPYKAQKHSYDAVDYNDDRLSKTMKPGLGTRIAAWLTNVVIVMIASSFPPVLVVLLAINLFVFLPHGKTLGMRFFELQYVNIAGVPLS